jgi:membrane-bound metal-dependent hydrolase YbcI (DUF457 family)
LTTRTTSGLLGLGAVLLADRLGLPRGRSRLLTGIVDELAHLGTGLVVLAAWPRPTPEFVAGLVGGSVLVDVDHLPELWGSAWLRPRGSRPIPHSLPGPLVLLWRSRGSNGAMVGAAVGLSAHLLRDLATGNTGVPLLWPLSRRPFSIRYGAYAAALAVLAGAGAAEPPRRPPPERPQAPA